MAVCKNRHFLFYLLFATLSTGYSYFKTEPSFLASKIHVINTLRANATALQSGYIFIAPIITHRKYGDVGGHGPQIFDNKGDLVWYGNDSSSHRVMRFHTCNHPTKDERALCWHGNTVNYGSRAPGVIRFLDNTYTHIPPDFGTVVVAEGLPDGPDEHEINTPFDEKNLVEAVYQRRRADLSGLGGPKRGHMVDSCFQEQDMQTREITFSWCALDHGFPLGDSIMVKNDTDGPHIVGDGLEETPHDPWHINGADKNIEGDYLISLRHIGSVLKIAGNSNPSGKRPGTILWNLRGSDASKSDFTQDFFFAGQHTCRFVNTSSSLEVITLFNNRGSQGQLIEVDNSTMTARLLSSYKSPGGVLPRSGGSMQFLKETKNAFVGWGNTYTQAAWYSEFQEDGQVLMHAKFGDDGEYSAQAWKHSWVGKPLTKPNLLPFALDCTSSLIAYVSWNGATEVKEWEFFFGNTSQGPWKSAGKFTKTGFETFATLSDAYAPYAYVTALDAGSVIGTSDATRTFMPNTKLRKHCTWQGCKKGFVYDYGKSQNNVDCPPKPDIKLSTPASSSLAMPSTMPSTMPASAPSSFASPTQSHVQSQAAVQSPSAAQTSPQNPYTAAGNLKSQIDGDELKTVVAFLLFCTIIETLEWVSGLLTFTSSLPTSYRMLPT